jgi:hypothetical protein
MILALVLALGGFTFEHVEPWKAVEGRPDMIPALSAVLWNGTGEDWAEADFLVRVHCTSGEQRAYEVKLRNVRRGAQTVHQTAFDAIGRVTSCEGAAEVVFLGGQAVPPQERMSYIVFGFSFRAGDGPASTDLEGILDYRDGSNQTSGTRAVFWHDSGARLEGVGDAATAYYAFRVRGGRMGLAGFLLNRDPLSVVPDRFLRTIDLPPDRAAFLGVFRVERTERGLVSVTLEVADEGWRELQTRFPLIEQRRWVRPNLFRQSSTSSPVRE